MFLQLLERHVRQGRLKLVGPDGKEYQFGGLSGPQVTWVLREADCLRPIFSNPTLALGETYMRGAWDVAEGSLSDLISLLRINLGHLASQKGWRRWLFTLVRTWNHINASRRHVAHHYDLDETLFRVMLDRDMHYSCAYFQDPDMSLEAAQQAKANHIGNKLLLAPGHQVLDIGSGWGSMALHLAQQESVAVTGLTLSTEQRRVACARADALGLASRVRFLLQDYREHEESYDRVVSVGMFEHVGLRNYQRYFAQLKRNLKPGGIALLHTIGTTRPPGPANPWIHKYIFPGGYIPSLSQILPALERSQLAITDVEVLRQHYALTLQEWHRRFQRQREQFVQTKGEHFCRMWEFYLSACQSGFEVADLVVFQLQLSNGQADIPMTRDYLYRKGRGESEPVRAPLRQRWLKSPESP